MTQIVFVAVVLIAFVIFALLKLTGYRVAFEPILKTLATAVVMLPLLVMSSLIIFMMEVLVCVAVILILYAAGMLAGLSNIPRQYTDFGLWALIAIAIGIAGFNWLRYVVLARDE